jgi:hypothetical protein
MGNILGWLVGTRSEQNRELDGDAPMAGRRRAQGGGRGAHARGNQSWPFIGGVHSALTQHKGRHASERGQGPARRGGDATRGGASSKALRVRTASGDTGSRDARPAGARTPMQSGTPRGARAWRALARERGVATRRHHS